MMKERVPNELITPGMTLYGWCEEARREQGNMAALQHGPEGVWHAMVVSNTLDVDPLDRNTRVHRITVLFTNGPQMLLRSVLYAEGGYSTVVS
jgi:hypothetical protein